MMLYCYDFICICMNKNAWKIKSQLSTCPNNQSHSVYAKRAGARAVYACEVDKFMCDMSGNILQANFNEPDIQILGRHSNSLAVPTHIPER